MNLKFKYLDSSKEIALDLLRVYLGLALVGKGYYFIRNLNELFELTSSAVSYGDFIISHYIIFAHIIGGACIAFGLLTRAAIITNIPILFGAVAFIHLKEGFFTPTQGLEISLMVFFLLCISLYHGSGRWSVDYYINRNNPYASDDTDNIINFSDYLLSKENDEKLELPDEDSDNTAARGDGEKSTDDKNKAA